MGDDMFGGMFDGQDEDELSLTTFTPGTQGSSHRVPRPVYFEQRSESNFVGLLNQGATCYMNSLIQAMYMTPELREGLYSLGPDELEVPLTAEEEQREIEAEAKAAAEAAARKAAASSSASTTTSSSTASNKTDEQDQQTDSNASTDAPKETEEAKELRATLAAMGFDSGVIDRAVIKFPRRSQQEQAVDWALNGAPEDTPSKDQASTGDDNKNGEGDDTKSSNSPANDKNEPATNLSKKNDSKDDDTLPFGGKKRYNLVQDNGEDDEAIFDLFSGASEAFGSDAFGAADDQEDEEDENKRREEEVRKQKQQQLQQQLADTRKTKLPGNRKEWQCKSCTYINRPAYRLCEMCEAERPEEVDEEEEENANNNNNNNDDTKESQQQQATAAEGENAAGEAAQGQQASNVEGDTNNTEAQQQPPKKRTKKRKIPIELQRLFAKLQLADQEAVSTEGLTDSFGWEGNEAFQQHDVHELNKVLFDAIERSLRNTKRENLINELYKGMTVNQIVCCACKNVSSREEPFQDLTLTVVGSSSVQESLASTTAFERLSGDNKYYCSVCDCKVDALKGAAFRQLPPILVLSLLRFTYDWETDQRNKHTGKFAFPLVLDMNPYTEETIEKTRIAIFQQTEAEEAERKIREQQEQEERERRRKLNEERSANQGKGLEARRPRTKKPSRRERKEQRKKEEEERETKRKQQEEEEKKAKEEKKEEGDNETTSMTEADEEAIAASMFGQDDEDYDHNAEKKNGNDNNSVIGEDGQKRTDSKKNGKDEDDNAPRVEQPPTDVHSPHLYDLFAVIIHTGRQAGYGHYHAYMRDVLGQGKSVPIKKEQPRKDQENGDDKKDKEKANYELDEEITEEGHPVRDMQLSGWYNFNDSRVTPISWKKLASQYEGAGECAYMLIYRRRELDVAAAKKAIEVPPHLCEEIEKHNDALAESRQKYLEEINKIDFMIYNTLHFKIDKGGVYKLESLPEGVKLRAKKIVTLDRSQTLDELRSMIIELFSDTIPKVDSLKLHEIRLRGARVIVAREFLPGDFPKKLDELSLSGGASILAWDGAHVGNDEWDEEADSIVIRVTRYSPPLAPSSSPADSSQAADANDTSSKSPAPGYLTPDDGELPIVEEFEVRIGEKSTLWELKEKLAKVTGIAADAQHLCKPGYKELLQLRENNISLFELGLYNESKVTLEPLPVDPKRSWAWMMFLIKQQLMEIFVTDACSGMDPPPLLVVEVSREISVYELKLAIVEKLPSGMVTLDQVILRKALPGNSSGPVLGDESLSLKAAGIDDGQRVVVEYGDPSKAVSMINLKFIGAFTTGIKQRTMQDPIEITISRKATVFECKKMMLDMFDKSPDSYRLYTTDIWGKPDRLFDDEKKTLEQAKIMDNDLLYIEEGKPPIKGQIAIDFQLYFIQESEFFSPDFNEKSAASSKDDDDDDDEYFKPQPLTPQEKAAAPFNEWNFWRTPLPEMELDEELMNPDKMELADGSEDEEDEGKSSSSESNDATTPSSASQSAKPANSETPTKLVCVYDTVLSPAVHLSPKTWLAKLTSPKSDSFMITPLFRLEVARSITLLNLKEQLIKKSVLDHVDSPRRIRLWREGNVLKHNSWNLKKQHVTNDAVLTMEILPVPDEDWTEDGILLYVHERCSETRGFKAPVQFWFMGETIEELQAELSALTGIPLEHASIAKYIHYNGKWRTILPREDEDEEANHKKKQKETEKERADEEKKEQTQKEEEKKGKEGPKTQQTGESENGVTNEGEQAVVNVFAGQAKKKAVQLKPYCLKDGDAIVIKDKRKDPANEDDFTQMLFNGKRRLPTRGPRGQRPRGAQRKTARAPEPVLKIHVEEF